MKYTEIVYVAEEIFIKTIRWNKLGKNKLGNKQKNYFKNVIIKKKMAK